jgi:chaperonin GroEL
MARRRRGEALATLVVNRLRGGLRSAVKARASVSPQAMLQEHRRLTGGQAISNRKHQDGEIDARHARSRQKVMIDKENTTIVNGAGKRPTSARVNQIKAQVGVTSD